MACKAQRFLIVIFPLLFTHTQSMHGTESKQLRALSFFSEEEQEKGASLVCRIASRWRLDQMDDAV